MLVKILWGISTSAALLLIVLVLLHSPKGDGIAGIGGASHVFASQKSAEKGLNKLTAIVAIIFFVCVFLISKVL